MPGPIDLLYTTIGGVIGAGLTQYVTHLRDRRAARALVIERIADVEEAFAVLRWTVPKDAYPPGTSQMASKLAALEAASLIAGVPRSILVCYAGACKFYEDALRGSFAVILVTKRMAEVLNDKDKLIKLTESPYGKSISENLGKLIENLKASPSSMEKAEHAALVFHDDAFHELSRALWRPLVLQFRRQRLRNLQQRADRFEKTNRELAAWVWSIESLYAQVFPGGDITKTAESAIPESR
jgi:hypothetical protein